MPLPPEDATGAAPGAAPVQMSLPPEDDAGAGPGAALVQMSLSPEDEAGRLAELAFGRGARRAAIIRPATAWGSKVEKALRLRWEALGGTFASDIAYGDREDHSSNVKAALGIPASEERARRVRDMLATNIEFTARRRQDIDAVFLLAANSVEARSLKPLLAFHYAGAIPVYSTSSIYTGLHDPRDRDLDGINLVEMPWLLGANPELRVAITAGDTGSDVYTRLNALGADAFLLQRDFPVLQAGPDALLRGNTGLLLMDSQQRIVRDLFPAAFDGGELQPR
jgi:outer membrane PBP1 activator LpoA protein